MNSEKYYEAKDRHWLLFLYGFLSATKGVDPQMLKRLEAYLFPILPNIQISSGISTGLDKRTDKKDNGDNK